MFTADLTPVDLTADTTYFFMVPSSTNSSFRWNNGEPTDGLLTFRIGDDGGVPGVRPGSAATGPSSPS